MLADAVAAESFKLLRQRSTLFWGFCAVPLGLLAWTVGLDTWLKLHQGDGMVGLTALARIAMRVDLGQQITGALVRGDTAFFKIFFAVGAAGIFGNEYRWETWRLLTPRNSRVNLLAAKFLVYALASAVSLAAMAAGAAIGAFYNAILNGAPLGLSPDFFTAAPALFAVSWTALLVLGGFVTLVAVAARATTGALMAGVVFIFAQSIVGSILSPWEAPLRYFALVPELPAQLLRGVISGQQIAPGVMASSERVLPAILVLVGWIAFLAGAALLRFQRQDLPRE